MKYCQEVTVWDCGYSVQNHIYYMNDSRTHAVGYIKAGTVRLVKFSKPITIETKNRKFVTLDRVGEADSVYFGVKKAEAAPAGIAVAGSGGKTYYLNKRGARWTCTCPGFTFRNTCKHTQSQS